MQRPIIGIVSKPLLKTQTYNSLWRDLYLKQDFSDILAGFNAICIGIIPQSIKINRENSSDIDLNGEDELTDKEKECLFSQIILCNGLILQGGLSSHKYEVFIAQYAIEHNIPILGVCAGFNNIARAVGTDVEYDAELAKMHDIYNTEPCHTILIQKNGQFLSKLNLKEDICVNSIHSMSLSTSATYPNEKIVVEATAKDSGLWGIPRVTVEAFSVKDLDFCLAVKWHPELLPDDKLTLFIFEEFINSCTNSNIRR